mmetsp:Transcript_38489/g.107260  ORF Transcript_38489/g.107260 Transcript_38489/m.107260 type:complete len:241 (-) Transcript_38489:347-1069(-)
MPRPHLAVPPPSAVARCAAGMPGRSNAGPPKHCRASLTCRPQRCLLRAPGAWQPQRHQRCCQRKAKDLPSQWSARTPWQHWARPPRPPHPHRRSWHPAICQAHGSLPAMLTRARRWQDLQPKGWLAAGQQQGLQTTGLRRRRRHRPQVRAKRRRSGRAGRPCRYWHRQPSAQPVPQFRRRCQRHLARPRPGLAMRLLRCHWQLWWQSPRLRMALGRQGVHSVSPRIWPGSSAPTPAPWPC